MYCIGQLGAQRFEDSLCPSYNDVVLRRHVNRGAWIGATRLKICFGQELAVRLTTLDRHCQHSLHRVVMVLLLGISVRCSGHNRLLRRSHFLWMRDLLFPSGLYTRLSWRMPKLVMLFGFAGSQNANV